MKSTGIVRRIDELGRIVIPKEIRRTLRIKDGESLEIFTDKDKIILKKYSSMDDYMENIETLVLILNKELDKNIIVTNKDSVIASSMKEMLDKEISSYIENCMKEKKVIDGSIFKNIDIVKDKHMECYHSIVYIYVNFEIIGSIIVISNDRITKEENRLLDITSKLISKQLDI